MITLNRIIDRDPFIIAEVGSNFSDLNDCMASISLAKNCGADAVKFQLYDYQSLFGIKGGELPGQLSLDWLPKLAEKAEACNIEFMCSAFSPELLELVNQFVNIHKLASSEMCHLRMLEKLKLYNKPTLISTGAQTLSDILRVNDFVENLPVIFMYCVAAYPAKMIDLREISFLEKFVRKPVGYSCHSLDVLEVPNSAFEAGAVCIEKHVNFVGASSPDSPHSLSTDEFKAMVERVRCTKQLESSLATSEQKDMVLRHKRRLIAMRDIEIGETLIEGENFGIFRSLKDDTRAEHPFRVGKVHGKKAKVRIDAGDGIWFEDLV